MKKKIPRTPWQKCFDGAFKDHLSVMNLVQKRSSSILGVAGLIKNRLLCGNKILVAGNGGSAADAQHFAAELVGRMKVERGAVSALALTTDTSILTAVGNDYGFDKIFSRQLEAFACVGDVFIAISTSGNSKNLIEALDVAYNRGCFTVVLSGKEKCALAEMSPEHHLYFPGPNSCRIQEAHEFVLHMLVDLLDTGEK